MDLDREDIAYLQFDDQQQKYVTMGYMPIRFSEIVRVIYAMDISIFYEQELYLITMKDGKNFYTTERAAKYIIKAKEYLYGGNWSKKSIF